MLLRLGIVSLVVLATFTITFTDWPMAQKVKDAYSQISEWTPENIREDPIGYLNYCESALSKTLNDIKNVEMNRSIALSRLQRAEQGATVGYDEGSKALSELKVLYRDNDWPVTWNNMPRSKEWMRKQIVIFHKQLSSKDKIISKCQEARAKIEKVAQKNASVKTDIIIQLNEIDMLKQVVQVDMMVEEVDDRLYSIKDSISALASRVENEGFYSLNDLPQDETTADFDKIMSE